MNRSIRRCSVRLAISVIAIASAQAHADDLPQPHITLTGHTSAVLAIAFSPKSDRLASINDDGTLKLWDVASHKELASFSELSNSRNEVRFTPDGKLLIALGRQNSLFLLDTDSLKPIDPIPEKSIQGGPKAFDISPDSKTVTVVGNSSLQFIDLASRAVNASYEVHNLYSVDAVAFSPDGKRVATASSDKTSIILEAATGKISSTLDLEMPGQNVVFCPDGKQVFAAENDQAIRVFNPDTGEGHKLLDSPGEIRSMAISPDGKTLILATGNRAPTIVSLPQGTIQPATIDSANLIYSAVQSPDSKWIAGGANEGSVYLWKTGK